MKPVIHRGNRRQAGLSMIELMVAMLLGLIVVAGLIQVLIANRKAYQIQQGNNYLQQNLRFASDRIQWSTRMADFWGGVKASSVGGLLTDGAGVSGCGTAWALAGKSGANGGGGIYGYDGQSAFPLSGCVADGNYVKGSDVLVVRYADTDACALDTGATSFTTDKCKPDASHYLIANVGGQATLIAGTTAPVLVGSTQRYAYPYRVEIFYLQPCSGPGDCNPTSDDGQPQPTLMRLHLDSAGKMVPEPLVSGIEQIQFEYGVSPDGQHITQYKSASQLLATEWPTVIAVRVSMVARNRERDISIPHSGTFALTQTCSYKVDATAGFSLTSSNGDCDGFDLSGLTRSDQFVRNLFQQIVQVRNRTRG